MLCLSTSNVSSRKLPSLVAASSSLNSCSLHRSVGTRRGQMLAQPSMDWIRRELYYYLRRLSGHEIGQISTRLCPVLTSGFSPSLFSPACLVKASTSEETLVRLSWILSRKEQFLSIESTTWFSGQSVELVARALRELMPSPSFRYPRSQSTHSFLPPGPKQGIPRITNQRAKRSWYCHSRRRVGS